MSQISNSDNSSSSSSGTVPAPGGGRGGNTSKPPSKTKKKHRCYTFTLNNHDEKDWISLARLADRVGAHIVMQEEKGDSGTPHIQGCVYWKNARHFNPVRVDLGRRCHIEVCRNWRASVDYCSDPSKRHGKSYQNFNLKSKVKDPLDGLTLFPWQKLCISLLSGDPDERKIYWFWDGVGRQGKSALSKHLCLTQGGIIVSGKSSDIKYAVCKTTNPRLIIVDIPRDNLNKISYGSLESVKNGCFFSTKYESRMCMFNTPHIVVFANVPPRFESFSADRHFESVFEIVEGVPFYYTVSGRGEPVPIE